MAFQPRLVNKQFNSPIGLYSEQNVREILDKETQMLANGAVGINFHNPMASKPANLHNSAVLRMLEEEESKQRNGQSHGSKRVAWPPPKEGEDEYSEQEPVQAQGGAQYSSQKPGLQKSPNNPQQVPINNQNPVSPQTVITSGAQSPVVYKPVSPSFNQPRPTNFSPTIVQKPWAPVHSPTSPQPQFQRSASPFQPPIPQQFQQPQYQPQPQHQPPQQQSQSPRQFQPVPNQQPLNSQPQQRSPVPQYQVAAVPQQPSSPQPQPQYRRPSPVKQVEPPPTTITLRPKVPISQAPAPLITSQPATATLKGGKNLRGDMKWPPENVKDRMDAENKARVELAKGPACRPRRVAKDYSSFFAQHALNSGYPGYKVPPGTQYYEHHPVM